METTHSPIPWDLSAWAVGPLLPTVSSLVIRALGAPPREVSERRRLDARRQLPADRLHGGRRVPLPGLSALGATTLIGVVDDCLQGVLPHRFFDWFDITFDFLAALMAVTGNAVLGWVRRRFSPAASPSR